MLRITLILALALLLIPMLAWARPTQVERLPACKSGWKQEAIPSNPGDRYIPLRYSYQVSGPGHVVFRIIGPDGRLLARVKRGQRVAFDCFDDTTRCARGDNCV